MTRENSDANGRDRRIEHGRPFWTRWRRGFTSERGASRAELSQRLARQEADLHMLRAKVLSIESALRSLSATQKIFVTPPEDALPLITELLTLLKPYRVTGHRKARIGRDHDCGYVMLDDFKAVAIALSLGIGADTTWDTVMAEKGIRVLQFDGTIETSPSAHQGCTFFCKCIVPSRPVDSREITIPDVINGHAAPDDDNLILKMDIEGEEWDVLDALEAGVLDRFRQIVCEFHDFRRVVKAEWRNRALRIFNKLNSSHAVVHIHGDNFRPMISIVDILIPDVIELTFVRRRSYKVMDAVTSLPGPLDNPNNPDRLDYYLGGGFNFGGDL